MEQGERRKTNPLLAGAAFLGALMAPIGAWGQQARGHPLTQQELARLLGPEEMERRAEYERSVQNDPKIQAELRVIAQRQARLEREGRTYCAQLQTRIRREGYQAVERDVGGMQMSDCGL